MNPHGSANVGKPVALKGSMLLRGKPNSGSCASVKGVATERVEAATWATTEALFGLPPSEGPA